MPRNGSGVFSPPAGTKAVPNTTIQSNKFNAFVDDLVADANNARPINAGGTGSTSVDGAVKNLGIISAKDIAGVNTVAGTANAVTIATDRVYTALTSSLFLRFIAQTDIAAGGMTINLDGIGAKPVKKVVAAGQVDVNAGDIISGGYYELGYDPLSDNGADPDGAFILLNGGSGSSAYQVGDFLDTARTLNSDWLKRNGALYDSADYPELSALLPAQPDGVSWANGSTGTSTNFNAICKGEGKFIAVGDGGAIYVSTDRRNWSPRASGITQNLKGIAYGLGIFVAIAQNGSTCVSTDGDTWTNGTIGMTLGQSIAFGNGTFVAGGESAGATDLRQSSDGSTWSSNVAPSGFGGCFCLAHNGTFFLGATQGSGSFNVAFKSTDGVSWTTAVTGINGLFRAIATDGTTFVMVGDSGVLITTTNGTTFTTRASGTTNALYGATYSSSGWLVVGAGGVARISTNATTWTSSATGSAVSLNGVAADTDAPAYYVAVGASGTALEGLRTSPTQFRTPDDAPVYGWMKAVS